MRNVIRGGEKGRGLPKSKICDAMTGNIRNCVLYL